MKKLNTYIALAALTTLVNAGTLDTLDIDKVTEVIPPVEVTTSYATDRVWRGSDLGQNEIVGSALTVFDMPADTTLSLNTVYTNADSATSSNDETEITAIFSKSVADYLLSLSYTWYSEDFDQQGSGQAQEVGLSVSRDIGPVTLYLTQYFGVEGDNNQYSEIGAAYSSNFDVLPVELNFTGEVGYLAQNSDFTHIELCVSTNLPVVENIIAQPFVAYNLQFGESFVSDIDSNDVFFGGVQFKRTF
jgi:hypothetical protein